MTAKFGRFEIDVVYRSLPEDEGPTIHVYGPTPSSNREEVLRFDCFRNEPHYHLAWSYREEPFIRIDAQDSFGWSMKQLANCSSTLLEQAGALQMTHEEHVHLSKLLPTLELNGRKLCPSS